MWEIDVLLFSEALYTISSCFGLTLKFKFLSLDSKAPIYPPGHVDQQ